MQEKDKFLKKQELKMEKWKHTDKPHSATVLRGRLCL